MQNVKESSIVSSKYLVIYIFTHNHAIQSLQVNVENIHFQLYKDTMLAHGTNVWLLPLWRGGGIFQ